MPVCKKCGGVFARTYRLNGKTHNLGKRTYCLECSPFGAHNTKKLDGSLDRRGKSRSFSADGTKICSVCQEPLREMEHGRCFGCAQRARKDSRSRVIYGVVGTACWLCDYDKGFQAIGVLEWHHVDPAKKLFSLSARETTAYAWDRVVRELHKCVLLCCRCHREHHAGLIMTEVLEALRIVRWGKYHLPPLAKLV